MTGPHPPGTVAVPTGDMTRYPQFTFSLTNVVRPPGTQVAMCRSLSLCRSLNTIAKDMVGDWLWLQADDHVFGPDTLIRLLDLDLDVVVPLIVRRQPPFSLVLFKERVDDGYVPFRYDEIPDEDPFPVLAAGSGGMLIRRHVLDDVGEPWFRTSGGDNQDEDLELCRRIREAGYTIYADPTTTMGHVGTFEVWPHRQQGHHGPVFHLGEDDTGEKNSIFVKAGREKVLV